MSKVKSTVEANEEAPVQPGHVKIDLSIDPELRPLAGPDIDRFRARHRLSIADVCYALALQSTGAYGVANRMEMMSVAREVLIRLYNLYPNPPAWREVTAKEAFKLLYGDVLDHWRGTPHHDDARIVLYGRFAALFGRAWCNSYRWIDGSGNVKAEIGRILAKIADIPEPRKVLEDVARHVLSLRGVDLDMEYPMPTPQHPPAPRVKGRKRKESASIGSFSPAETSADAEVSGVRKSARAKDKKATKSTTSRKVAKPSARTAVKRVRKAADT